MSSDWKKFETLMVAASGNASLCEQEAKKHDFHFHKVVSKQKALEKQVSKFSNASEETIMDEYRKLREAHRDFLASFKEAKNAYFNDSFLSIPQKPFKGRRNPYYA